MLNRIAVIEDYHRPIAALQSPDRSPIDLSSPSTRCLSAEINVPPDDQESSSVPLVPPPPHLLSIPSSASSRAKTSHIRIVKLSLSQKASVEPTEARATSVSVTRIRRSASFNRTMQRPATGPSHGHEN